MYLRDISNWYLPSLYWQSLWCDCTHTSCCFQILMSQIYFKYIWWYIWLRLHSGFCRLALLSQSCITAAMTNAAWNSRSVGMRLGDFVLWVLSSASTLEGYSKKKIPHVSPFLLKCENLLQCFVFKTSGGYFRKPLLCKCFVWFTWCQKFTCSQAVLFFRSQETETPPGKG